MSIPGPKQPPRLHGEGCICGDSPRSSCPSRAKWIADTATPKAQEGEWTLTAPDGRTWRADSPLKCVSAEINERVPPDVRLARIRRELDQPETDVLGPTCRWYSDGDAVWQTECKKEFAFDDACSPYEAKFFTCPFCAKTLLQAPPEDEFVFDGAEAQP